MDDREAGQQKLDNLEVSDEHLLLAKGLWSFVDGTEVLADGADAAARTDFQQKTQKAFSTIVMAVSVPQLYLITSTESPSDVDSTQKSIRERNFSQQADVEEAVLQNGNDRERLRKSSMAGTDEKWTIEKLDSKNWITWKFQMSICFWPKDYGVSLMEQKG